MDPLNRFLPFALEVSDGTAGDGGAAPPVEAPPVAVAPAAPAAQPLDQAQIREAVGQSIAEILGPVSDYQPEPQQYPEFDPEVLQQQQAEAWLQQQIQAGVQSQIGEFQPYLEKMRQSEDRARTVADLDQIAASIGEFDRDDAIRRAGQLVVQQGLDVPQALQRAAQEARTYEQSLRTTGQGPIVKAIQEHGAPAVDAFYKANPEGDISTLPAFLESLKATQGQPAQPGAPISAVPEGDEAWRKAETTEETIRLGVQEAVARLNGASLGSG